MISKYILDSISRGSLIRIMFERGKRLKEEFGNENVYDLTLGNPILEPPPEYFEALKTVSELRHHGLHRYMVNVGFDDVRANIANWLNQKGLLPGATKEHVAMTIGAGGALNVILRAILDPGDEVVIFAPYFVEYLFYVAAHQGKAIIVDTNSDFTLNLDELDKKITRRTKAVIINSPNNPSGRVYTKELLNQFVALLEEKQRKYRKPILLISDEPYRELVFDNIEVPPVCAMYSNSLMVYSWSKSLSIPGDRIGYIAFNPNIQAPRMLDALSFCLRLLGFVNAPATIQIVVNKLLDVTVDIQQYQKKRDRIFNALQAAGYEIVKPEGTFYLFPKSPDKNNITFIEKALERRVLLVPGQGFGCPNYFRIAYCTDDRTIDKALEVLVDLR
ncbi:pyridoxal phosphate-dependent aminotransferase [candidate division KSB1 bacterium]|nr:pyridoxal phosphate-dependent aminotransferase [candidate division KSB1 bacterium]